MITVRNLDSLGKVALFRDEMDALNQRTACPDPFSTFSFFESYCQHDELYPSSYEPCVWFLLAFRSDQLVGYLPLKRTVRVKLGISIASIGFLITHDTDRPHIVSRPEDIQAVCAAFFQYLFSQKSQWSYLEFVQQDASSPLLHMGDTINLRGYMTRSWPSLENCTIHIRWQNLHDYFIALTKKFRSNLARQLNNLVASGELELLNSADPDSTPALLELYLGIEHHSWKSKANAHIGRHPHRIEYFKSLLHAQQSMQISIQILLLDGVPVAGLVSGVFAGRLYALQIVYDDRLGHLAPGSAILLMGMREAIGHGYSAFNLLSGFAYFKARWLAETTPLNIAQLYRNGSLMYWRRHIGDWRRRLLPPESRTKRILFNLSRRTVTADAKLEVTAGSGPNAHFKPCDRITPEAELVRIQELVLRAKMGHGEFLSRTQLEAVIQKAQRG